MREYFKILIFRAVRVWPVLIFCLFGFQSIIFYIGTGPSWTEYDHLFGQCDRYWWTVIFFMNDLIPFFAKDLIGCMRWTAIFSIEMKLFLMLPIITYLYYIGKERIAFAICCLLIIIGQLFYFQSLYVLKIFPGYLHLLDY
jgi:hypothetical protein